MSRRRRSSPPGVVYPGYPNDLLPQDISLEAWEAAKLETYRFLLNQHLFHYDLVTLLASVYLQGCLDGAQVAQRLATGWRTEKGANMNDDVGEKDRWQHRPVTAASRWYTVEVDSNGVLWLIAEDTDRVRLEPGMQLDVVQIAWRRTLSTAVVTSRPSACHPQTKKG